MMPWHSIMESTYRPVPEQVAQSNAPLASQQVQRLLSPISFSDMDNPTGSSIISSGIDLS